MNGSIFGNDLARLKLACLGGKASGWDDFQANLKKAGVEKIGFAWAGDTEPGKKHYYRVQGPTFLVEYDNTQNDGNHIHSVWRDFDGDFGRDLLREHLKSVAH